VAGDAGTGGIAPAGACLIPGSAAAAGLAALRARRQQALLALDYDGTLAPIVLDPAAAHPQPGCRDALRAAAAVFGAVAILSGRSAAGVVRLLDLDAPDAPALSVVGVHGHQTWSANLGLQHRPPHPGLRRARADLEDLLDVLGSGVRVEDKGHSLAVHFRGCPVPAVAAAAGAELIGRLAERHGLDVQAGRLVLELLGPGSDKGAALRQLAGCARAVCYVGDDLADLAAFAVVDELRGAGVPGLKVAVANVESRAPAAAADLVLADPAAVVDFIVALTAHCVA
jgi:trehalose 6-phosphate phosphatase